MLRDYELALSNYRLISTDFKLDKAWKRYAGVQVISCFINFDFHVERVLGCCMVFVPYAFVRLGIFLGVEMVEGYCTIFFIYFLKQR